MVMLVLSPVKQWFTARSVRMRKKRSVSSSPYNASQVVLHLLALVACFTKTRWLTVSH